MTRFEVFKTIVGAIALTILLVVFAIIFMAY